MNGFQIALDSVVEAITPISFSKVGYNIRNQAGLFEPYTIPDSLGIAITGPTSGLGLEIARSLSLSNTRLFLLARDESKLEALTHELSDLGDAKLHPILCDIGNRESIERAVEELKSKGEALDVLINNAGALHNSYMTNSESYELTFATHVLGTYRLTNLLQPLLMQGDKPGIVITMSSGGMYTSKLDIPQLSSRKQLPSYAGAKTYAMAKRAQIALTEEFARRTPPNECVFHVMHPGWVDTPGIKASLPKFYKATKPFLRTAAQGVDTALWLTANSAGADALSSVSSGKFWLDRRPRSTSKLHGINHSAEQAEELWQLCSEA